jgi:hypothetical protein
MVRLSIVLVAVTGSLCGCSSEPVPAPASYDAYRASTGAFKCLYPSGWQVTGGGRENFYGVRFEMGGAAITVKADLAGSLLGDIASPFGAGTGGGLSKEEMVHELGLKRAEEEIPGYQEMPAQKIKVPLGRGARSEFTASDIFGRKTHGYRVTVLGTQKRITVLCTCPEAEWATLKPAFDKVVESLEFGGVGS